MMALALALATVTGVALGLLGGGGSILTVPVFVYVLGFDAKTAIAMSLAVVGVTSVAGTIGHWRQGQVNAKVALTFGSVAMAGTYAGARLAIFVSGTFQLAASSRSSWLRRPSSCCAIVVQKMLIARRPR